MCYEPEKTDNAPLDENGKKELPFPDVYDCKELVFGEDLLEFKARYLEKHMELMTAVNVLTYYIKGAERKGVIH